MTDTCLLIIDIQNDYFPGGKMELVGSEQAGQTAGQLLTAFRQRQWPTVHIQHLSLRPGATFFIPNTPGADIHSSVQPTPTETVMIKHYPNSFRDTSLLTHLQAQGIKRVVVAGMMTHMCVDASVRAAADLGFTCLVAQDACATRNLTFSGREVAAADVHAAFLAALNGVYSRVMPTTAILETLESE